ncbi:MAG: hypothetical protein AAF611_18335 [Bacteroidota bacterium]
MELEIIVNPSMGYHLIKSKAVELSISSSAGDSQPKKIVEIIVDRTL